MTPIVSIIIPTYNRANSLKGTIDSVINQTFEDYEIIVVDDGSSDNTKDVIESIAANAVYIFQDNQGPASARNTGIKKARGKYIAFIDSDDLWEADKLQKMMDILIKDQNIDALASGYNTITKDKKEISVLERVEWSEKFGRLIEIKGVDLLLLKTPFIPVTSMVIVKKSVFEESGFFDESLKCGEDRLMWVKIVENYRFLFLCEVLATLNVSGEGLSRDDPYLILKDTKLLLKKIFQETKVGFRRPFLERRSYSYLYFQTACNFRENSEFGRALCFMVLSILKYPFGLGKSYKYSFFVRTKVTIRILGEYFSRMLKLG